MSRITLKDKHFRIIGYIETRSDGVHVGKDADFRIVGYYEPKTNQTKDSHFRIVAHGDILSGLIHDAAS